MAEAELSTTVERFLDERSDENYSALATALFPKLVHYFFVRGLDYSTAEDLTQNVLLSVYRHASRLRARNFFWAWLYKIAANEMLQHIRRQKRSVSMVGLDSIPEDAGPTVEPVFELRSAADFRVHIEVLEPDQRKIILMRYGQHLRYEQIADKLEIPLGTVKWKIFDAKRRLAAYNAAQSDSRA